MYVGACTQLDHQASCSPRRPYLYPHHTMYDSLSYIDPTNPNRALLSRPTSASSDRFLVQGVACDDKLVRMDRESDEFLKEVCILVMYVSYICMYEIFNR